MSLTPDEIADLARQPKTVTVDGTTKTERDAADLRQLDEYARAAKIADDPTQALRWRKLSPPAATD
jgi:hypothetical protein